MQMEQRVLGIDVAKETLDIALSDGYRLQHGQFANTEKGHMQIEYWLRERSATNVHVCMEATGQYGDKVAEYLYTQGFSVSVVNPARIKHYANSKLRRNKTDKADAQLIAEYCVREKPAFWTPPPASFKELQALVRHLEDLQGLKRQEANRLQSGVRSTFVLDNLTSICDYLDEQIRNTKREIQEHINRHNELKRMQELLITIPGIGKLTASKLLGEIRNVVDFQSARQLAAYAGLTPRNFLSGTSVHKKSRLSKTGNTNLRKALYMPAVVAKRRNPIIRSFCERLSQNGLQPMEVIGAAMRKLLHLVFGILKTGRPFDPNYLNLVQTLS
jgi:transposase